MTWSRKALTLEDLEPTWEAYQRLGHIELVAAEFNLSPAAVQGRLRRYRKLANIPTPPVGGKRVPHLLAKNAQLKTELTQIVELFHLIDEKIDKLVQRVEALENRPPLVLPSSQGFVPSHRRIADGGLPVKVQRKSYDRQRGNNEPYPNVRSGSNGAGRSAR